MTAARRRLRRLLTGGVLSLAGCLAALAVVEAAVRLVAPQTLERDEGLFVPDPILGFRLRPGFQGAEVSHEFDVPVRINSRGLRDREIAPGKPPGTTRILVLGDSFTYGSGVAAEDTYPKRLERLLAARGPGAVEVINAGVSGWGTVHEAAFLRREGWAYEPDVLVLQVFPNNDLDENLHPWSREVRGGFLRFRTDRPAGPAWLERAKEVVRRRSHAYRFLGDRYHLLRIRLGLEPFYAASLGVYRRQPSAETLRGWEVTGQHVAAIAAMARARGVPVLVVHAPRSAALDARLRAEFARFHRVSPADLDWDLPGRRLGEVARQEGLPYLDLGPRFAATGRPLDFYYPHNGHWNARGHEQVARWILERLDAGGLLPGPGQPASAAR